MLNNTTLSEAAVGNLTICDPPDLTYRGWKLFGVAITLLIMVAGLVCNCLIVATMHKKQKKTSTDIYITALAVLDNIVLLNISLYAYRYAYTQMFPDKQIWIHAGLAVLSGVLIMHYSHMANTYVIVMLSLDRYMQVKHSIAYKDWTTPQRAIKVLIGLMIFSFVYNITRFWEYVPLLANSDKTVSHCYGFYYYLLPDNPNLISNDFNYTLAYQFVLFIIMLYAIPLSILCFTNYTLIKTIWIQREQWFKLNKVAPAERANVQSKRSELQTIFSLVLVTIFFMVFQVPNLSLHVIWITKPSIGALFEIFAFVITIINSTINFLIFMTTSVSFKRSFKRLTEKEESGSSGTRST